MVTRATRRFLTIGIVSILSLGFATPLYGDISTNALTITATTASGQASYTHIFDPTLYDPQTGTYEWIMQGPISLMDGSGHLLATVMGLSTHIEGDPLVNVNFLLQAGHEDVQINVLSATVSFDTMDPAEGVFSAQIGGTDMNGNGITINGTTGAGRIWWASSNDQTFAIIVDSQSAGPWGSTAMGQTYPETGTEPLAVPVNNMWTEASFVLSAGDLASGTSVYRLTPEPFSITLLLIGSFVVFRRR